MNSHDGMRSIIKQLREQKGLSRKQLALGICDESLLRKYENGSRNLNIFIQIRLLERMGEFSGQFEFYANNIEYQEWVSRQKITDAYITNNEIILNKEIDSYKQSYLTNSLSEQFLFEYKAFSLLRKNEISPSDTLCAEEYLNQAINKTIHYENGTLCNQCLSPEEINLLIEHSMCLSLTEAYNELSKLYNYVETRYISTETEIIILPKIVYKLTLMHSKFDCATQDNLDIISIVAYTINLLIKSKRTHYLLELIEYASTYHCTSDLYSSKRIFLMYLKQITNHSFKTINDSYLISNATVINLGMIIKKRRNMMRLSVNELAENICDERTVMRIENCKTNSQIEVLRALLNKLNISNTLQKNNFLSDELSQYQSEIIIRHALGNNDFNTATNEINKLKTTLDLNNIYNVQYISVREKSIEHRTHQISNYEYYEELKKALELTLNINTLSFKNIYLSRAEINCCYNIALLPLNTPERLTTIDCMKALLNSQQTNTLVDLKITEMSLIACGNHSIEIKNYKQAFVYYQNLLQIELTNYRTHLLYYSLTMLKLCIVNDKTIKNSEYSKALDLAITHYNEFITL